MISSDVIEDVGNIIFSGLGLLNKWAQIEKILLSNGLAYKQELPPELFVVHPSNRGGFGINAWNCHAKGSMICAMGADLSQLTGSVAFEMSAAKKDEQIKFTKDLALASEGLLAIPSGAERFMTVSKGHTTQFMKSIKNSCRTPQAKLASQDGHLGSHLFAKDPSLQKMVQTGWTWTIILSIVEDKFPQLPALIEAACNSTNATYEAQNEIQLMSAVVSHVKNVSSKDGKHDFAAIADGLCLGGPIKSYAPMVGRYVQRHGGMQLLMLYCMRALFMSVAPVALIAHECSCYYSHAFIGS